MTQEQKVFCYERWVNIYEGRAGGMHTSVENAEKAATGPVIARVRILIKGKEGVFDE